MIRPASTRINVNVSREHGSKVARRSIFAGQANSKVPFVHHPTRRGDRAGNASPRPTCRSSGLRRGSFWAASSELPALLMHLTETPPSIRSSFKRAVSAPW